MPHVLLFILIYSFIVYTILSNFNSLCVFFERWHEQTSNLYIPIREMTMTTNDLSCLRHLHIIVSRRPPLSLYIYSSRDVWVLLDVPLTLFLYKNKNISFLWWTRFEPRTLHICNWIPSCCLSTAFSLVQLLVIGFNPTVHTKNGGNGN